jgi:hypothetical protein
MKGIRAWAQPVGRLEERGGMGTEDEYVFSLVELLESLEARPRPPGKSPVHLVGKGVLVPAIIGILINGLLVAFFTSTLLKALSGS